MSTTTTPSSTPNVVGVTLGTMEFGRVDRESHTQEASERQVARFASFVLPEGAVPTRVLDTARMYSGGETEAILGRMPREVLDDVTPVVQLHTKVNPWCEGGLAPASVRAQLEASLKALQRESVELVYLHAPDHKVPIEETLAAMHELHREGKFHRLGLSNFAAWQVVEAVHLCRANGWLAPTVYQGMYNALTREVERELFPALAKYNIAFYAYNPLAGGVLAGRLKRADLELPPEAHGPSRFFHNAWAQAYRDRYARPEFFDALDRIQPAIAAAYPDGSVTLADAALRWLVHHSGLRAARGDTIILGASSVAHLDANLASYARGPLDARVVEAFEEGWRCTKAVCPSYYR